MSYAQFELLRFLAIMFGIGAGGYLLYGIVDVLRQP